jgi:hypothetical protein
MKALLSFKTPENTKAVTQRHIPEDLGTQVIMI